MLTFSPFITFRRCVGLFHYLLYSLHRGALRFGLGLPNFLTILRLILIPFVLYFILIDGFGKALGIFVCIALSDFFDGYTARKFRYVTATGTLLDPVADKVLLCASWLVLFLKQQLFLIPAPFVWFVIIRELIIIFGGLALFLSNKKMVLHEPTIGGKLATAFQMVLVIILLSSFYLKGKMIQFIFPVLLFGVFLVMIVSLLHYIVKFIRHFAKKQGG